MYIEAVSNRNSPPAILLRESYREGGKVRRLRRLVVRELPRMSEQRLRALSGFGKLSRQLLSGTPSSGG
jgi:hypothetical protein